MPLNRRKYIFFSLLKKALESISNELDKSLILLSHGPSTNNADLGMNLEDLFDENGENLFQVKEKILPNGKFSSHL